MISWAYITEWRITRGRFVKNLNAKLRHPGYLEDCVALLSPEESFDLPGDADLVKTRLLSLLPDPVARSARRSRQPDVRTAGERGGFPPRSTGGP
jgi:hypothetical protein